MHSIAFILAFGNVLPSALHLNVDATLRAETRGGVLRADATRAVLMQQHEITPGTNVQLAEGPWRFTGTYAAQALVNPFSQSQAPLLLHRGNARAERYTKRGDVIQLQVGGLVGQLDYGRATRLLTEEGAGILASFPTDSRVVDYANGDASASAVVRHTRRSSTVFGLGAGYTGPAREASRGLVLRQWRANLFVQQRYLLTSRDTVIGELGVARVTFLNGPQYLGASPSASYVRTMSPTSQLVLRVGLQVTYTRPPQLRDGPPAEPGASWMPVGRLSYNGVLARSRTMTLRGEASAGVAPFYDPFRATLLPRSVVTGALSLTGPWRLESNLGVAWYQAFTRGAIRTTRAEVITEAFGAPRETLIAGNASLRRRFGTSLVGELGGIITARDENLPRVQRDLTRPEMLGYAALTANFDLWN